MPRTEENRLRWIFKGNAIDRNCTMAMVRETSMKAAKSAEISADISNAARIEELGQIIRAYSEVTEKLQQSHGQLQRTVQSLRNELSEKNRQLQRRERLA